MYVHTREWRAEGVGGLRPDTHCDIARRKKKNNADDRAGVVEAMACDGSGKAGDDARSWCGKDNGIDTDRDR